MLQHMWTESAHDQDLTLKFITMHVVFYYSMRLFVLMESRSFSRFLYFSGYPPPIRKYSQHCSDVAINEPPLPLVEQATPTFTDPAEPRTFCHCALAFITVSVWLYLNSAVSVQYFVAVLACDSLINQSMGVFTDWDRDSISRDKPLSYSKSKPLNNYPVFRGLINTLQHVQGDIVHCRGDHIL